LAYHIYTLISESTGRRYIGQAADLDRRVSEHDDSNQNPHKDTSRTAGHWRLIYSQELCTEADAMTRCQWLKSEFGRTWLDLKIGRASPHFSGTLRLN
jgi:predicted GIY-YIG superfamily endonuclease